MNDMLRLQQEYGDRSGLIEEKVYNDMLGLYKEELQRKRNEIEQE